MLRLLYSERGGEYPEWLMILVGLDKIGFAACQHPQDMCFHGAVGFSLPLPHKVLFAMLATRIALITTWVISFLTFLAA